MRLAKQGTGTRRVDIFKKALEKAEREGRRDFERGKLLEGSNPYPLSGESMRKLRESWSAGWIAAKRGIPVGGDMTQVFSVVGGPGPGPVPTPPIRYKE
jgi:hypothetical protein